MALNLLASVTLAADQISTKCMFKQCDFT